MLLLMLFSLLMEYNLMKLIAHENEGLLQVQFQTFCTYSKNSDYQPSLIRQGIGGYRIRKIRLRSQF